MMRTEMVSLTAFFFLCVFPLNEHLCVVFYPCVDLTRCNVWILDGDLYHKGLLKFAVSAQSLSDCLAVFVVDMSRPWIIMDSLQKWSSVLRDHVDKLKIEPDVLREMEQRSESGFICCLTWICKMRLTPTPGKESSHRWRRAACIALLHGWFEVTIRWSSAVCSDWRLLVLINGTVVLFWLILELVVSCSWIVSCVWKGCCILDMFVQPPFFWTWSSSVCSFCLQLWRYTCDSIKLLVLWVECVGTGSNVSCHCWSAVNRNNTQYALPLNMWHKEVC